ncbi:SDR family NAD(P)-dependent oxidoreductase [Streptosporangium sp. NBC_01756]|uniref:SDR family NAD(P)-dependent oxidoreductase n=1 Tax=Streptosporangium sp. NBC_01756 TaxID=2975950 RepID=UPI002DD8C55D|nr:SDR family NAD(P)-dependent oxidoreductase [Streptosporangium sp. NBC_01756]WSC84617.1 SDR family oxidoreductase [Streptosporangium sp. NBC_01756]
MAENTAFSVDRRSMLAAGLAGLAVVGTVGRAEAVPAPAKGSARRFEDKVVVITGATSGIGRATAVAFAQEGAKVGFCGRRTQLGREVEQEIRRAGGEATYVRADVRREDDVRRFVDQIAGKYGGLDIAFNNAGVNWFVELEKTSLDQWNDLMATNVTGVFLAMKYQIPHMVNRGGGVIIVTSSVAGTATRPGGSAYAASKRALAGIVQAAALDYGSKKIRTVAIAPGTIRTPIFEVNRPDGLTDEQWEAEVVKWGAANVDALKRIGRPEELAASVLAVAEPGQSFLTGTEILVDGGMTAGL